MYGGRVTFLATIMMSEDTDAKYETIKVEARPERQP